MNKKFEDFNLDKYIIKALYNLNYTIPSKVQEEVIPRLLKKEDVIVKSKTGSGKTASFGIPICENIDIENNNVQALIVVPTRELALQVKDEISNIGRLKKIRCSAIFGKQPIKEQIRELKQRVHIVVATPGRIIDHIGRNTINLDDIKYFIIDEADKMLNKGFIEDMEFILNKIPKKSAKGLFVALRAVSSSIPIRFISLATAATDLIGISVASVIIPSILCFFAASTIPSISIVLITSFITPGTSNPTALGFISTAITSYPISLAFSMAGSCKILAPKIIIFLLIFIPHTLNFCLFFFT